MFCPLERSHLCASGHPKTTVILFVFSTTPTRHLARSTLSKMGEYKRHNWDISASDTFCFLRGLQLSAHTFFDSASLDEQLLELRSRHVKRHYLEGIVDQIAKSLIVFIFLFLLCFPSLWFGWYLHIASFTGVCSSPVAVCVVLRVLVV